MLASGRKVIMSFNIFQSQGFMRNTWVAIALAAFSCVAHANSILLDISVVEDGEDVLYLQGNTLQWQHFTQFANGTATINAYVNGVQVLTNASWANGDTGLECTANGGTLNCPVFEPTSYTLPASVALPSLAQTVTLQSLVATPSGGLVATAGCASPPCTITIPTDSNDQQPTVADSYTLKVDLNDTAPGGTHTYSISLAFNTPVPEATTFFLTGAGLIGAALMLRRAAAGRARGNQSRARVAPYDPGDSELR